MDNTSDKQTPGSPGDEGGRPTEAGDAAAAPEPAARVAAHGGGGEEGLKETIEALIIAFVLAFVGRGFVVEAFVIPTGSMAPTLLGQHLHVTCDQCGYSFASDWPDHSTVRLADDERVGVAMREPTAATCPMCRHSVEFPRATPPSSGDRILVQKYVYSLAEPRRWDVAVFKNPQEPAVNFIKRLVGLPNEQIHLLDGNVYVRSIGEAGEPVEGWRVARKTRREDVQRAVWQPIYHSQYLPRDGGQVGTGLHQHRRQPWRVPWVADDPAAWRIEGRRSYQYDGQGGAGVIRFDFAAGGDDELAGVYPYNQFKDNRMRPEPIEDVRIAAHVQPAAAGLGVTLATTARLHDTDHQDTRIGAEPLVARLEGDGTLRLIAGRGDRERELARVSVAPLATGRSTAVELWHVDQEASVWVDGERVLNHQLNPSMRVLMRRPPPEDVPEVAIALDGPATLHAVELDRDLYYSGRSYQSTPPRVARGALERMGDGRVMPAQPVTIRADEFFMVGDNGPWSDDGRYWTTVDAGVEARHFTDRLAAGMNAAGLVPRELMMGRAFFVYYPAPLSWQTTGRRLIPHFGAMRAIH
ncbi:MAG: S26 family signal peptidase [Phycisphaeraceae bacterium]